MSIVRYFTIGWQSILIWHTVIYLTLTLIAIYRKRLSSNFKIAVLALLYLTVGFIGLIKFSLAGASFYIALTIALLVILVNRRALLYLFSIILLIFCLIAYGFVSGYLQPTADLNTLSRLSSHWITHIVSFFSLIIMFVFGFGDFNTALIKVLKTKDAAEKKYRQLFEQAHDAILLFKDGVFIDCNQQACEAFQYKREELIGKNVEDVSPEFQSEGVRSDVMAKHLIELTLSGFPQNFDWQHMRADGTLFDLSISLNTIEIEDGIYVQAILHDITKSKRRETELKMYRNHLETLVNEKTKDLEATVDNLKKAQAQLIQSEKMASLGTLTSGVAHEINNPLNFILGSHRGLEEYFEEHGSKDQKSTDNLLEHIKNGVDRATSIVKSLGQFSRNNNSMTETCDVHAIIDNCLLMLNNLTIYKVEVQKGYSKEMIRTMGNVGQLHQVFTNILTNAIHSIESEGKITIATSREADDIIITISDNGSGIKEEDLLQITDPFFTTKQPGEGTGLGLSIAYNIIQAHRGELAFSSELGKGTTVRISFKVFET
ncbi:MAG: PAS domain S-box protein [Cyclobacteriaceae bacterium]